MTVRRYVVVATVIGMIGVIGFFWLRPSKPGPIPAVTLAGIGTPTPDLKYHVQADLSGLPVTAKVYPFMKVHYTIDDAVSLAHKLGVNGPPTLTPVSHVAIRDGAKFFRFEPNTGKFAYLNSAAEAAYFQGVKGTVPSSTEAASIAERKLTELGLLPPDFRLAGVTPNRVYNGSQVPDRDQGDVISWDVHFYRYFNNKQVAGVSRIIVTVGNAGEVTALKSYFKPVDLNGGISYPLRKPQEAFAAMESKDGIIVVDDRAKDVTITNIEVAYFEDPGEEQPYLQPVYVFHGTTTIDGEEHPFQSIQTAIDSKYQLPPVSR